MPIYLQVIVCILKNKDIYNLKVEVNHELKIIKNWIKFNHLSFNCSKSSFFIVIPHHKNSANDLNNFSVKVSGFNIPSLISTK